MTPSAVFDPHHANIVGEIQSLPKIDLHRHLEGSLRLGTMQEIVAAYDLDLPASVDELQPMVQMVAGDPRSAPVFLAKFKIIRQFFPNPEIIQRHVEEVIEDAALDGVELLELRFTPAALRQASGLPLHELMDAVLASSQAAAANHRVTLGLIVSVNRHESLDLAEEVVRLAVDRMPAGILGVDLAGDEQTYSADPFIALFAEAKQAGLNVTIHAGEWGGPERVAHAVGVMAADRIGHGVRCLEDPAVVQLARAAGVGFEVSLSSNLQTGVFREAEGHPLAEMIEAGLRVAVTTDDPSIFGTTLSAEHVYAIEHLGLSLETIKGLTLQALQLSFVDPKVKRKLEARLRQCFWGSGV
ncbi:MAG: adenosine deaminase [Anaerolineales bacterium]|nr:MAG: adenosine deaminase [Anaerolineales bacterium]